MMKFIQLSARVLNTPLAIHEPKLNAIMAVLGPRFAGQPASDGDNPGDRPAVRVDVAHFAAENGQMQRLAAGTEGVPLATSAPVARIQVIEIDGSLVSRSSGMCGWSGLASYESIKQAINEGAADASIDAIMLRVDSPGGEVNGIQSLQDAIRAARKAKPVWCSVDSIAFSACCWIATQCDRVVLTPDGQMGSIGVIALHYEQSKFEQIAGVKYTAIYSGEHKNDLNPHEPLDKSAAASVQADVDGVYDVFCSSVAEGRGLDIQSVKGTGAAIYRGQQCLDAGLADELGDYEFALNALASQVAGKRRAAPAARAEAAQLVPAPEDKPSATMATSNKGAIMATTETKKAEDLPGDPEEDKEKEMSKEKPKAASPAEILALCKDNGIEAQPEMFGLSIEQVALRVLQARKGAEPKVQADAPAKPSSGLTAIERAAAQVRGAEPQLSAHQSVARALRANPALYDQYERQAAASRPSVLE